MENRESKTTHESFGADRLKEKAAEAGEQVKTMGKDQLEEGKRKGADNVERLAGALDDATESLHDRGQHSLAEYVEELAASARSLAAGVRDRSLNELVSDTQSLARRNPALFFFGSVAVGIGLSRFLKASGERQSSHESMVPSRPDRSMAQPTGAPPDGVTPANRPEHPAHPAENRNELYQKGI
jgi:hypothetical protein